MRRTIRSCRSLRANISRDIFRERRSCRSKARTTSFLRRRRPGRNSSGSLASFWQAMRMRRFGAVRCEASTTEQDPQLHGRGTDQHCLFRERRWPRLWSRRRSGSPPREGPNEPVVQALDGRVERANHFVAHDMRGFGMSELEPTVLDLRFNARRPCRNRRRCGAGDVRPDRNRARCADRDRLMPRAIRNACAS